ncbi:MAG: hypothetical protein AABY87_10060 [bacterium]
MKGRRLGRGLEEISDVFFSAESSKTVTDIPLDRSVPEFDAKRQAMPEIQTIGITGGPMDTMGIFAICNISIELARQGYRVLVVDDDPGNLNVTRLMGLMDIENAAEPILIHAPMGVRTTYRTPFLSHLLSYRDIHQNGNRYPWPEEYQKFDFIIFHIPYNRLEELGAMLRQISLFMVIAPTDRTGMLESYSVIKALHQKARQIQIGLIVLSEKGEQDASDAFSRMAGNTKRFLQKDLLSYAFIQKCEEIGKSMAEGVPLVLKWSTSEMRRHIYNISRLIIDDHDQRLRSIEKAHVL